MNFDNLVEDAKALGAVQLPANGNLIVHPDKIKALILEYIERDRKQRDLEKATLVGHEPVAWCNGETVQKWKGDKYNAAFMFPSPAGLKAPIPLFTHAQPTPAQIAEIRDKAFLEAAEVVENWGEARTFSRGGAALRNCAVELRRMVSKLRKGEPL